jgi:type IV pilus assembly protein PilE
LLQEQNVTLHRTQRSSPRRSIHRGFTLIELMITVAIVAILARVAIPSYLEYVKRGKMTEAFNTLSSFSLTMNQWYQDNRTYVGACTAGTMAATPTGQNFVFDCPTLTATGYTIRATGQGSLNNYVYTLDQTGFRASTAPSGSGWPNSPVTTPPTSCWISSKSGSCY